jgi:error-prone DNA polymerase
MSYVELHCHSNFSFLQGASHPEQLIARAAELEYDSLALTDCDGFYGVVRFHQAAKKYGVRPIFGATVTLDDSRRLVLLIKNELGYANLSQMLSTAHLAGRKGQAPVTWETLCRYARGLIALWNGTGSKSNELKRDIRQFRELFGPENFFLELVHHHLPQHEAQCEQLATLAGALKTGVVATNDVHYAYPEDRRLQDVLTCIRHHVTLDSAGQLLYPNGQRYLKSAREMDRVFARWPQALASTRRIAERCRFDMAQLSTSLPDFPLPEDESPDSYLRTLAYKGARDRYGEPGEREKRQLEHELAIIKRLRLAAYFLIVWDIVRFCMERGIRCQGRGSAANSVVCYCLGVTAVDPVRLELLFERFVSEDRSEPPDIDIDIANNRREEVIQYVYARYGREHAAMVCEVITYRGRSAVREVGKALGFSLQEVDHLAKQLNHFSRGEELGERLAELRINLNDHRVRLLLELVEHIRDFPRHLGIHVGGMIIARRPLSQIVPIENATMSGRSVIQWDKDDVEAVGMVKIDLLGLGMLSLIDIALKLVKKHHEVTIDPARLGYDDPRVYQLLSSADTVGVFQVESRAQMNTLPRHKPTRFYDLVVEVALIRPGPIQGDMVHPYLRRRNGEEPVTYPHPCLEPILRRTLGIPLFQEQGMRVAMEAAGFTPSQADELRRAMGHKRSRERMEELGARLIGGMIRRGISEQAAERIFHQLSAFADFGFTESHAASFALLVYVSAYLKVYYPTEFYCALLNAQPMGFYTPATIVYEARRKGVQILGVDVRRSEWDCTVESGAVRLGFRTIKHAGESAQEVLNAALADRPFVSVADVVYRSGLNRRALEQLAVVGGFAGFGLDRRQALWTVMGLTGRSQAELQLSTRETGQHTLQPMSIGEQIVADFAGMDLSVGPHPIALIRSRLRKRRVLSAEMLNRVRDNTPVTVAGMVVIRQRPMTAKGFVFLTLEDETGFINVVVKPTMLRRFRREVIFAGALQVKGVVEATSGVINVIGHWFASLEFDPQPRQFKSRDFR